MLRISKHLLLIPLFLLCAVTVLADVYVVPNANIYTAKWRESVQERSESYGGCSHFTVGYDDVLFQISHYRTSFAIIHLADSLIGDVGTTNIDSVRIKFYVRTMTVDSVHQYWFRLDSTKPIHEGTACGSVEDCGTNWINWKEGTGGDPQCTDAAWTTGGGDYYSDTLFVSHCIATGWNEWLVTSSDGLLSYFENIIDGVSTLDTSRAEGMACIIGGLVLLQDSTGEEDIGTDVVFMSEDTTVFQPVITFYGNWEWASLDVAVHKKGWLWEAHRQGRSRILHKKP